MPKKGLAQLKPSKLPKLGKYCWIQGYWKAEVTYQCAEYVSCIPLDEWKVAKKNNPRLAKMFMIRTYVPSLIKECPRK